jgi:nicotinamide riboside kinase
VGLAALAAAGGGSRKRATALNASLTTGPGRALCVAVLGAESTGKTTLAQALASSLSPVPGPSGPADGARPLRTAWVPEVLRLWCDERGRTPHAHEQAAILQAQHARIDAAAQDHDVVICDTTGLMTAVYSELVFGDRALHEQAARLHKRMALSLVMALDLPWVADGHQRDGPQVREPVDRMLRALLLQHALPFAVIGGSGPARLQQARAALAPLLRRHLNERAEAAGLFTRLQPHSDDNDNSTGSGGWSCECCGDAANERALRRIGAA